MKYVIDDEELINICFKKGVRFPKILVDYMQSKTPVEEIAEGETKYDPTHCETYFRYTNDIATDLLREIHKFTQGKNIKIYIEVIK